MKGGKIRGSFIYPTYCDKRTEGDMGKSVLYERYKHCAETGTILSDGINKYVTFLYGFLCPQFGNLIVYMTL
jgi:hypothetical protein